MVVGCLGTPGSTLAGVLTAMLVLLLCGLCWIAGYHIVRRQVMPHAADGPSRS